MSLLIWMYFIPRKRMSIFIQTYVWRQIADELIERNPAAGYVEIRDKVDSELTAVFKQYYGSLDKYLEKRAADALDTIPDFK
ncbi:hypothetical protein [Pseudomonas serbica]|uniref:hypothetical protein n=1 Tax=Pseudomonas serbica TaxID=2965074 RepID=UPI00237A8696|nr:hypothetical protein [Pseudomonas serbica]